MSMPITQTFLQKGFGHQEVLDQKVLPLGKALPLGKEQK